jgi:hypothetical protein
MVFLSRTFPSDLDTKVRFTQWLIAGAYQVRCSACNFLVGFIRVLYLKGGFDLEGVERARSGRDAFLCDHLRRAGALPANSGSAVEVGAFERSGLAHSKRRPNAGTVVGCKAPDTAVRRVLGTVKRQIARTGIAENGEPDIDFRRR